jgi:hypothetical protein
MTVGAEGTAGAPLTLRGLIARGIAACRVFTEPHLLRAGSS